MARSTVPVSLPAGLVRELDKLVRSGHFASRSEALRHGARLVVMFQERLHVRSAVLAYDAAKERENRRGGGRAVS